jgi:hypothetical protein
MKYGRSRNVNLIRDGTFNSHVSSTSSERSTCKGKTSFQSGVWTSLWSQRTEAPSFGLLQLFGIHIPVRGAHPIMYHYTATRHAWL